MKWIGKDSFCSPELYFPNLFVVNLFHLRDIPLPRSFFLFLSYSLGIVLPVMINEEMVLMLIDLRAGME